ncbi:MAG TPA: hypothetical protein VML55_04520 [Planctomycetaceae bacterium]|nr:hypothetical protein [Planctomycetaceae bacterium]
MRKSIVGALAVVSVASLGAGLQAQDGPAGNDAREARSIVRKGIQALGGREALNKTKVSTWKEQGTYYGMGDGLPYTGEYAVEWPDKFKMTIQGVFTIVLKGDKGWMGSAGMVRELTGDELAEQQEQNHSRYVASLLFLGTRGYRLAKLDDAEVDGKPAAVVKVTREGRRDVTLSFDKDSGLLVKAEYRLKSPEQGGKEVTEEAFLREYREVDGVKLATKLVVNRDGQKFVETDLSDTRFPEKLDASVFAKPQ